MCQLQTTLATESLISVMKMPYTRALFESSPRLENPVHSKLNAIDGRPPNLISPPEGCRFAPRCAYAAKRCYEKEPELSSSDDKDHRAACWYPLTYAGKASGTSRPITNKQHRLSN